MQIKVRLDHNFNNFLLHIFLQLNSESMFFVFTVCTIQEYYGQQSLYLIKRVNKYNAHYVSNIHLFVIF